MKNSRDLRMSYFYKKCIEDKVYQLTKFPFDLEVIKNPCDKIIMTAVSSNGHAIKCVKSPSEELQLVAVTNEGRAIAHIPDPSNPVQIAAVIADPFAIHLIHKPCIQAMLLV